MSLNCSMTRCSMTHSMMKMNGRDTLLLLLLEELTEDDDDDVDEEELLLRKQVSYMNTSVSL